MSKVQKKYICQSCGYLSPKWIGKCPNCEGWNSFVEEIVTQKLKINLPKSSNLKTVLLSEVSAENNIRTKTNLNEFDRVLGGGIVDGSVTLIGGDPGIGKSTLMLQMASQLKDKVVLYITGEESLKQIKLRSERIKTKINDIQLFAETNLEIINEVIEQSNPEIVIIDSIQTLYLPQLESTPGSVSQMREAATLLTRIAKSKNISFFLIGHVTKDGMIAGPRVIEHIVDTVLQFEGEKNYNFRILRAYKNRFGSTNEIGIFEMIEEGLIEVENPSALFLNERTNNSGSAITAIMEGSRPILVEVQALVTPSYYGVPQRTVTGFDLRRLQMLLAVIEKIIGLKLGSFDIFVNIAGGLKIVETAADLAISLAIISSFKNKVINKDFVSIGEIGLGGEIRNISFLDKRIQESTKLGFKNIMLPKNKLKYSDSINYKLSFVQSLNDAINIFTN